MPYAVTIERSAIGALYDVRGARDEIERAMAKLGVALPEAPNTRSTHDGVDLCWVGPQRWLLRSPAEAERAAALAPLDRSPATSALDVTDAYALFTVAGPDAEAIFAQATPLDVHASAFPANGASFTEFFGQTALVARHGDGFSVLIDASYADYIERFLVAAGG